jgi:hypothetical protein
LPDQTDRIEAGFSIGQTEDSAAFAGGFSTQAGKASGQGRNRARSRGKGSDPSLDRGEAVAGAIAKTDWRTLLRQAAISETEVRHWQNLAALAEAIGEARYLEEIEGTAQRERSKRRGCAPAVAPGWPRAGLKAPQRTDPRQPPAGDRRLRHCRQPVAAHALVLSEELPMPR